MASLRRQVIIVALCLAATIAAKIYMDRAVREDGPSSAATAPEGTPVTVELPTGPRLATP